MSQTAGTILTGGTVIDGTGSPGFPSDVVIQSGRIMRVGKAAEASAAEGNAPWKVIDCTGCVVAPGFIDAHSHSDLQLLKNRPEKLVQGVTTEIVGNCGFSPYPSPEDPQTLREFANPILYGDNGWGWKTASGYLQSASESRIATVASLVGHGALRIKVAGNSCRELTSQELDTMCGLLDDALREGAAGFSSGLMYAPGSSASRHELTSLCRVVARRGKIYATHMRNYSNALVEAVEEQISIAEAAGCRLQISHLQAGGPDNWGSQQYAIAAIEQASMRGVDVGFDAYPWLAGSTVLTQVLPQAALDGGTSALLSRLRDPAQRESIRPRIKPEAHWDGVVITSAANHAASLVGKSIEEIAEERGTTPGDVVMDILLEAQAEVMIVEHCQSIENLRALLTHTLSMVVTDGVYTSGRSHPRLYGTFPLLFGNIVRERKWLTLEEAIHKVTGKPAAAFRLDGRGRIQEGFIADVTVFDPETIHTDATYEIPDVRPSGIKLVLRNGEILVDSDTVV